MNPFFTHHVRWLLVIAFLYAGPLVIAQVNEEEPDIAVEEEEEEDDILVKQNLLFAFQYQQLTVDDFNAEAAELGFPALEDRIFEVALIGERQLWRFLNGFGAAFAWGNAGSRTDSEPQSLYRHLALRNELTFALTNPESNWVIGPMVNVSLQYAWVNLRDPNRVSNLQSATEVDYVKLRSFDVPVEFAIRAQFGTYEGEDAGFVVGITAGYRLNDDDWRFDGAVPVRGLGLSEQGWFASIRLGFQGMGEIDD